MRSLSIHPAAWRRSTTRWTWASASGVHLERAAEGVGQRLEGAVVGGRTEPAADHHPGDREVAGGAPHRVGDRRRAVPDHLDAHTRIAGLAQLTGEPVGVGVEGEATEDLVADRDDDGSAGAVDHGCERYQRAATPRRDRRGRAATIPRFAAAKPSVRPPQPTRFP